MNSCSFTVAIAMIVATLAVFSSVAVSQENQPPVASFSFSPLEPHVGEKVAFDATDSSDPDGIISTYEWDFESDGVIDASGFQATYVFPAAGEYEITLVVLDNQGLSSTVIKTIIVREGADLGPLKGLSLWVGGSLVGDTLIFEGSIGLTITGNVIAVVTAGYGSDEYTDLHLSSLEVSLMFKAFRQFYLGIGGGMLRGHAREQRIPITTINIKIGFKVGLVGVLSGIRIGF